MRKPVPSKPATLFFGGVVTISILLTLTGCDLLTVSQTGRNLREGNEAMVRGEVPRALQHFEAALDGTMLSAEAHYRLGLLYEDKLKNEVGALHHFERYLELAPQGQFATDVKGYVDRLRLVIVSRLADGPVMPAREAARLKNENLDLRQQLTDMRQQTGISGRGGASAVKPAAPTPAPKPVATPAMVVAATPPPATAPAVSSEPEVRRAVPVSAALPADATATDVAPRVEPVIGGAGSARATGLDPAIASAAPAGEAGVRTYKVESGDTLAGIARKYYKNSGQWQKIAEANKATLSDPTKLKPGMILVIPE
jgi:LysM repeat protein